MKSWETLFIDAVVAGAMAWALIVCAVAFLLRALWLRMRDG